MQLFILILVSLNLFPANNDVELTTTAENDLVIEIINPDKIKFDFSMKYEARRKMIKVRSEHAVRSLQVVEMATNTQKGYNVAGSELIFLPKSDFTVGTHLAEFRFNDSRKVIKAKIHVTEAGLVNG